MHIGREPGTGISVAWSRATMFQPNSSAARAGKAASRSRVTVNSPLTMSSGVSRWPRSVRGAARRWRRGSRRRRCAHGGGAADALETRLGRVMEHNVAGLVRLMLVTDDRLVGGTRPRGAGARGRGGRGRRGAASAQAAHRRASRSTLARALVAALRIPVLVNDRPDVAVAAGAAGVHLGPDDLPVALARRMVPPGFVIGASVGSEAEAAAARDADYWGIGPWRAPAPRRMRAPGSGSEGFARWWRWAAGGRASRSAGSGRTMLRRSCGRWRGRGGGVRDSRVRKTSRRGADGMPPGFGREGGYVYRSRRPCMPSQLGDVWRCSSYVRVKCAGRRAPPRSRGTDVAG